MKFHLKNARMVTAFASNDVRSVFAQHTGANGYNVYEHGETKTYLLTMDDDGVIWRHWEGDKYKTDY